MTSLDALRSRPEWPAVLACLQVLDAGETPMTAGEVATEVAKLDGLRLITSRGVAQKLRMAAMAVPPLVHRWTIDGSPYAYDLAVAGHAEVDRNG